MLKLIAMDMDGTLLNDRQEISRGNLKALRDARSKGVALAIASGRPFFDIVTLLKTVDIKAHVIGGNGSTIYSMDGKLLGTDSLDREEALNMIAELTMNHYFVSVSTEHWIWGHEDGENWLQKELIRLHMHDNRAEGYQRPTKRSYHRLFRKWQDIKDSGEEIQKILVFSFDEAKLQKARENYEAGRHYNIVSSGPGNFEIMARNVSKGNALYHLAAYLDIPLEKVMAIGDNYNDLSMFEVAGISVAMGNADDIIKSKCSRVTLNCSDDGVAHAIYEELNRK